MIRLMTSSGYCELCEFPLLYITKGKTLTLIGSLINGTSEAFRGMQKIKKGRMKGDDNAIDTAQTQKCLDGRLALLENI